MRKTARFPARDLISFRKKVIHWAGNFSVSTCFDSNGYETIPPNREFLAGVGVMELMNSSGDILSSLKEFHQKKKDWLFGFFSYDLKKEIEPRVFLKTDVRFDGVQFPEAFFFRAQHIIEIVNHEVIIHSIDDPEKIFNEIENTIAKEFQAISKAIQPRIGRNEYLECVNQLKEHIANGDLYEVNLCQEFFTEEVVLNPESLFCRLNELSPAPFACFVRHNNHYLLCASPERFLKKTGSKIFSQPMKGTIQKSNDESNEVLKEHLRNDPKERAENVMIVDLVRNDLSKSAVPGTVKVEELFGVYTFPNVHQMISTVSAVVDEEVHFTEIIKDTFPMGSMTGAPKVAAMQLIDYYEPVKRGLFSGTVGFITPENDFDFNVVIRSILYNSTSGYLSFQAGSAITYDCSAEKEYEECMLKTRTMMQAISGKQIFPFV